VRNEIFLVLSRSVFVFIFIFLIKKKTRKYNTQTSWGRFLFAK